MDKARRITGSGSLLKIIRAASIKNGRGSYGLSSHTFRSLCPEPALAITRAASPSGSVTVTCPLVARELARVNTRIGVTSELCDSL